MRRLSQQAIYPDESHTKIFKSLLATASRALSAQSSTLALLLSNFFPVS
jgi:hypothetical protein